MTGTGRPWAAINAIGIATIASYGGWFYGFGVLILPIASDTGWSVTALGLAYGGAQLLTGLGAVLAGRLLDRRGARVTLGLGGMAGGGLLIATASATSVEMFVVMFAVSGGIIGSTGFYHSTMVVARRLDPAHPARIIQPLTIWGAFASPLFLPLTAALVQSTSWQMTLRVLGATTTLGMLLAAVIVGGTTTAPPADHGPSLPTRQVLRHLRTDRPARHLVGYAMAASFATSTLLTFQVPVMTALGLSLATAATLAGGRGLAQLTGRVGLHRMLQRISPRDALIGVSGVAVAACLLLLGAGAMIPAVAFMLLAGFAVGAESPLEGIYAAEVLPDRSFGTLMGAQTSLGGLTGALGPVIGGVIAGRAGFPAVVGLIIGGYVVAGLALASTPRNPAGTPALR